MNLLGWLPPAPATWSCLIGFGCACIVAYVVTPWIGRFARAVGAVDLPGGRRIHERPVARFGGLGIIVALMVAAPLAVLPALDTLPRLAGRPTTLLPTLAGATLVCGLGAYDDYKSIRPAVKLAGLTAIAAMMPILGVHIDYIGIPGYGLVALGWMAAPVTVVWLLFCANAMNLIDGVDGAASGVAVTAAGALALISMATDDVAAAVLFATTCGAAAGFLVHNRQPARIFLGDSGSLTLGFLLGAASASSCTKRPTALSLAVALCVFAVPLLDTTQSFLRRFRTALRTEDHRRVIRALKATAVADTGHIHHRLLRHGLSHREIAHTMATATLIGSLTAMLFIPSTHVGLPLVLGALAAVALVLYRLGTARVGRTRHEPDVVIPANPPVVRPAQTASHHDEKPVVIPAKLRSPPARVSSSSSTPGA